MTRAVIVGAGPAGISAAAILVSQGLRPILLDEGRLPGGQAYRQPAANPALSIDALLGAEAGKYRRIHATFDRVRPQIDYRSESLVWSIFDREVHARHRGRSEAHPFDALILAPGAIDRVLPIPGWTLPGVVTLGAAQILLKEQASLLGSRVVFCGSSPLLYLAALQYRKMGADVVAVLDTTQFSRKLRALPDLLASPGTLRRGLHYLSALRGLGVHVRHGVRLQRVEGATEVEALGYRDRRGEQRIECDTVAMGFGLRPETQLAELAGCRLSYDPHFRQWFPASDSDGRSGDGVYWPAMVPRSAAPMRPRSAGSSRPMRCLKTSACRRRPLCASRLRGS